MTKLFFLVSGEHRTLPFAEIRAILESENLSFTRVAIFPRVLCLDSNMEGASLVASRSSMTKVCGLELFRREIGKEEIRRCVNKVSYGDYVKKGQSFSVRVKSIVSSYVDTLGLEGEIGRIISGKIKGVRVNLVNPDRCFFGLLTDSVLIFGVKLAEASPKRFVERMPAKRPFLHPSTMSPKLARCMVNLARAKPGSLVLDPFCGAGSILLEAGHMGCRVLGSDVKAVMVRGSLSNLEYFRIPFAGLIVGDARRLPFKAVDCIVSDPPYGRASSTLGLSTKELVSDFLSNVMDVLPKGGYVSLSLLGGLNWREVALDFGYEFVEGHFVREHKSLTREILIIKKP